MKLNIQLCAAALLLGGAFASCDDFLDKEPPSYIVPSDYYTAEDQVLAIANQFYQDVLPAHSGWGYGTFGTDDNTDNQAGMGASSKYAKGQWKVGQTNGNWAWGNIRNINYQLNAIMTNYDAKKISGSDANIRQYIGEIHFFRAYCYFDMLQKWGDLPIVTQAFPDDEAILVAANKRSPRNKVARFILNDLDSAITYMTDGFESRRTRVSPDVARLFKSRVALYEGSWLTNFKGTPFVPGDAKWPGASKDYNKDFKYEAGSIDAEAKYFFGVAAEEADKVASKYVENLSENTGIVPQAASDTNPYFYEFGNTDMTAYPEVLLWKEFSKSLGIENNVEVAIQHGDIAAGITRGMVEGFLMKDGKPAYDSQYEYSDTSVNKVWVNKDPRLQIFLKRPGQKNVFKNMDYTAGDHAIQTEPVPNITNRSSEKGYSTGYAIRKGGTFDRALCGNGQGYTASITFRATEALLNYIEAEYMLYQDQNINHGNIVKYWEAIRKAAGFTGSAINPQTTIDATNMAKETAGLTTGTAYDWGAFTAGKPVDATLYSIRRERRCELMAEALRWMDLERWRSLDQLIQHPYHIEGIRIWNTPMEKWYPGLADEVGDAVSAKDRGEYLRPYEIQTENNLYYNGFTWAMAQYLQPMPIKQFLLTATDHASVDQSPLYQNPYWPTTADEPAEQ